MKNPSTLNWLVNVTTISPKTFSTHHGINNIKAITLKSLTELLNQSYRLWLDLIGNIIIIYPSYSALNLCPSKNYNTFSIVDRNSIGLLKNNIILVVKQMLSFGEEKSLCL